MTWKGGGWMSSEIDTLLKISKNLMQFWIYKEPNLAIRRKFFIFVHFNFSSNWLWVIPGLLYFTTYYRLGHFLGLEFLVRNEEISRISESFVYGLGEALNHYFFFIKLLIKGPRPSLKKGHRTLGDAICSSQNGI